MTVAADRNSRPAPGSDEALKQGCKCPVLDNAHGKGSRFGPGTYWYTEGCPVHPVALRPREEGQ